MKPIEPRPPLWRVMEDAYGSIQHGPPPPEVECFAAIVAAEIRAIRDEIVRRFDLHDEGPVAGVVAWLSAEATRAEAGE